jgi:hypothetical protein
MSALHSFHSWDDEIIGIDGLSIAEKELIEHFGIYPIGMNWIWC